MTNPARAALIRLLCLLLLAGGCSGTEEPSLPDTLDRTVVLDSIAGDSVLGYHPVIPDSLVAAPSLLVLVDTTIKFQVMKGWEAHTQSGNATAGFATWQNQLMDLAVNDLGVNRLRLEVRAGVENPVDYFALFQAGTITMTEYRNTWYTAVNDNTNSNSINAAGYKWSAMDAHITEVVLPIRSRLQARGESLYLNLNYVAFHAGGAIHTNPAEYAELILAAFQHMQSRFGFVPDAVEVILEPDNNTLFTAPIIGQIIAKTGARLAAAGFHPDVIAPSVTDAANAVPWLDQIVAQAGANTYLTDVAYHRYKNATDAKVSSIGSRARQLGLRTAMLEHIGSDVESLYRDLTLANASAWQQFALAFPTTDNGAQYYTITNGIPVMGSRTRQLRQYFKYVRIGAVRVGATSNSGVVRPVAFQHPTLGETVVLHLSQAGRIGIRGMAAGRYGVTMATSAQAGIVLPDLVVGPDGSMTITIAAAGVVTVFRK